jgi:hypothetical protein
MSFDKEQGHNLIVAHVRALEPRDWKGLPGQYFRKITAAISKFAKKHRVRPSEVLDEGVVLGRRKLEGMASKEYAAAVKDFADAEHRKIETELERRSLESRVRKEEADARLAEIAALNAELELIVKLKEYGVVLKVTDRKVLAVLPTPTSCDLTKLAGERLRASADISPPLGKMPKDDTPDTNG